MKPTFDVVVVGGGVIGLAHAYAAVRQGNGALRVAIIESNTYAQGASIRNFGMLWPVGQPAGHRRTTALRSRDIWLELLRASGIWHRETGSLHVCHHDDEVAVITEYLAATGDEHQVWIDRSACLNKSPWLNPDGLKGGLWSDTEIQVDPRVVIREIPQYLSQIHGVELYYGQTVISVSDEGAVRLASGNVLTANHVYVCSGHDIRNLYPDVLSKYNLIPCKLQMMRTEPVPNGAMLGPMLAGGLTLTHYESFKSCATLDTLVKRYQSQWHEQVTHGIHVLVSQASDGALTLGDSHEYGNQVMPFSETHIDDYILKYLATFMRLPSPVIQERWTGVYVKSPTSPWIVDHPQRNVTVINGFGGAGMTLSMGVADLVVAEQLGDNYGT